MKILWVMVRPLGPASDILGMEFAGSSGGWIQTEYEALPPGTQLAYLCMSPKVKEGTIVHKSGAAGDAYCIHAPRFTFGLKPSKKYIAEIDSLIRKISPDVIQLWGTETIISYAVSVCVPTVPKVIYIQGLIGMHCRYTSGYMLAEDRVYYPRITCRKRLMAKIKSICFRRQVELEQECIRNCRNVITDNIFTQAYCNSFADGVRFFQRTLLPNQKFYEAVPWSIDKAEPCSIFSIFGTNEAKGLQQLLKALAIVKRSFPAVKLYIPGPFAIADGKLKEGKIARYQGWLRNYIKAHDLSDSVVFAGKQDAEGMITYMQKCRLFVSPSAMEVHSSSLREAMTIGIPAVSSICGSIPEYCEHGKTAMLYRYEEHEVLAEYIKSLFTDEQKCKELSVNAREKMRMMSVLPQSIDSFTIYRTLQQG